MGSVARYRALESAIPAMKLICYPLLSTRSKRAMLREKSSYGADYHYRPRGHLLQRLSIETGLSAEDCYQQLLKERDYLLKNT
mgnify:CR=1 FL=1